MVSKANMNYVIKIMLPLISVNGCAVQRIYTIVNCKKRKVLMLGQGPKALQEPYHPIDISIDSSHPFPLLQNENQ